MPDSSEPPKDASSPSQARSWVMPIIISAWRMEPISRPAPTATELTMRRVR